MLSVAHLVNGTVPPQPARAPARWYPRFGSIYFDTLPGGGQEKMFATVADDRWNATQRFLIGLRLTSKRKELRRRGEVPLSGGPAIVGDIQLIQTARLEQTSPPSALHSQPARCHRAWVPDGAQLVRRAIERLVQWRCVGQTHSWVESSAQGGVSSGGKSGSMVRFGATHTDGDFTILPT